MYWRCFLMIYTFFIIIVFTVFITIKNNKGISSLWLVGVLLGFGLSITGFIFYSVYFLDYYYLRNILLDMNKHLWLFLYSLHISSYAVSRILNIGIGLFYYSALCFSISYSRIFYTSNKIKPKKALILSYILLAFFPIQFVLFYDPYIQNELYAFINLSNSNISFFEILKYCAIFNRMWFFSFIAFSILLLSRMYLQIQNKYIKQKALAINISLFTLFLLFIAIFYWAPETIVILRGGKLPCDVNQYFYETYVALEVYPSILIYKIYPFLSIISFSAIVFALYKYNILKFVNMQLSIKANTKIKIEQLSSVVSHMVKNKLIEINILLKDTESQDNIDSIRNQLKCITQITDDLTNKLEVMNSKNKELFFCFKLVCINHIITYAISKVKQTNTNIKINTYMPDENLECYADEYHLTEVFVNIINNSIEAIDRNNGIIDIHIYMEHGWNVISISDNGSGIPSQDLKKIFSPFFSTKSTSKNWGIGLTYCYKTIKAHKGVMMFDSKVNVGTRFNIMLPVVFT